MKSASLPGSSEPSTLCLNAAPDPGTRGTLGPDVARPYAERVVVGIGMQRLHAGDDAEFAEAGDVLGGDGFDVLDARAGILCVIHYGGVLVGVERQAHGFVSDRVRENLKAALVEIGDGGFVFAGIPEQFPALR